MKTAPGVWGKTTSDGITRARAFASDPHARDAIDYSATNMYDHQEFFNRPDDCGPYLRQCRELTADKPEQLDGDISAYVVVAAEFTYGAPPR